MPWTMTSEELDRLGAVVVDEESPRPRERQSPMVDVPHYRIVKWEQYQHYKHRRPPWIKLYKEFIESDVWVMSDDASRVLAIACMVYASKHENYIKADQESLEYFQKSCHLNAPPDFRRLVRCGFIELIGGASNVLASCRQDASNLQPKSCSETETETETETEKELRNTTVEQKLDRGVEIREVFTHYRTYHPKAHPTPRPESREWRAIRKRITEGFDLYQLKKAIDGCHRTPHNLGDNDRHQQYLSLELIMRSGDQVTRFCENADRFADGQPMHLSPTSEHNLAAAQEWLAMKGAGNASK